MANGKKLVTGFGGDWVGSKLQYIDLQIPQSLFAHALFAVKPGTECGELSPVSPGLFLPHFLSALIMLDGQGVEHPGAGAKSEGAKSVANAIWFEDRPWDGKHDPRVSGGSRGSVGARNVPMVPPRDVRGSAFIPSWPRLWVASKP